MGRPSRIMLSTSAAAVTVAGSACPVMEGRLLL